MVRTKFVNCCKKIKNKPKINTQYVHDTVHVVLCKYNLQSPWRTICAKTLRGPASSNIVAYEMSYENFHSSKHNIINVFKRKISTFSVCYRFILFFGHKTLPFSFRDNDTLNRASPQAFGKFTNKSKQSSKSKNNNLSGIKTIPARFERILDMNTLYHVSMGIRLLFLHLFGVTEYIIYNVMRIIWTVSVYVHLYK